ncbi:hypothetical protein ACFSQ7_13145 [Paenibacillus rhizoplanae]
MCRRRSVMRRIAGGRLTEAAERAERFVRIRELQEERARRESQRQALLAQEEQILLLEQKLGKADEAERRLPALKAWRSAEEAWKTRAARAGGLEALAAAAVQEAAAGAEAEAAAQAALSAGEPALREEEGRYRRALELEAELGALHSERAALQARREEAARGLAAGRESLARERELFGPRPKETARAAAEPAAAGGPLPGAAVSAGSHAETAGTAFCRGPAGIGRT